MGVRLLLVISILLGCGLSVARAEDKPWAAGVSAADQKRALALYQEGNGFFEQSQYVKALEKYKEAIASWDHPAIRYNTAVCLINLDRPVEAYENLTAALRFGDAPLEPDEYKQGLSYQKLLAGQIAEIEVSCAEPEATVSLDAEFLFTGPGTATRVIRAGEEHRLVAAKPRYQADSRLIIVPARDKKVIKLEPKRLGAGTLKRRMSSWIPWTVLAAGAVASGVGIPLIVQGRRGIGNYDDEVDAACPVGCPPGDPLLIPIDGRRADADRKQSTAIGLFATGGALVVTGLLLVYINQPRLESAPAIVPQVGRDSAGVVISASW